MKLIIFKSPYPISSGFPPTTLSLSFSLSVSLSLSMTLFFPSSLHSCRISYYGVFDGHAGPRASQYAAENLHKNIIGKLPKGMYSLLLISDLLHVQ